jgi:hypothetical protein
MCADASKDTIKGCGNPSHVRNVVEKGGEDNQKVGKTN